MNWYKQAISFNRYEYKIPEDPKNLMYDFYMTTAFPEIDSTDRNSESLNLIVQDIKEKLYPYLKKHISQALSFAISSEFRHVYAESNFSEEAAEYPESFENDTRYLDFMNDFQTKMMRDVAFTDDVNNRLDELGQRNDSPRSHTRARSYAIIRELMDEKDMDRREFVQMAKDLFSDLEWSPAYGGDSWAGVCTAWLKLDAANSLSDLQVWIDHAYSIQHNTDTVFNKLTHYYKDGYQWIAQALDEKFEAKSPYELMHGISPSLKSVATYIFKAGGYGTVETEYGNIQQEK